MESLSDKTLDWLSKQESVLKTLLAKRENVDFNTGRLIFLMDVKSFILTDGTLNELTESTSTLSIKV